MAELPALAGAGSFRNHALDRFMAQTERLGEVEENSRLSPEKRAQMLKAAKGFESMFVSMMMKNMREAFLDDPDSKGDDGVGMNFGGGTLQGLADLQFADSIAEKGGMGLAAKVYEHLTGEKMPLATPTVRAAKPELPLATLKNSTTTLEGLSRLQRSFTAPKLGSTESEPSAKTGDIDALVRDASRKYGISEPLLYAVIKAESSGNPNAVSPAGAKGLMQLMDGTAGDLGVQNPFDPAQNIDGGTRYLRQMLDRFGGNKELALAAYNAGPGNVAKYNGIPPFPETKNYISKVIEYEKQFFSAQNSENEKKI